MMFDNRVPSRSVIVVLGAGRSGTSLAMQIMVGMGGIVSSDLITANSSNPEGFLEDAQIRDVHVELMDKFFTHPSVPLEHNWLNTNTARHALQIIEQLVKQRLNSACGIWCVKDPLINSLLPMWFKVFNRLRIVPKYVLALRNPGAMVASFVRQYGYDTNLAELVVLNRLTDALHNIAADCFVVHYEDWFDAQVPLAQGLLHFTGLESYFKGNLSDVLANIVKPNLNRASKEDYEIRNPYVLKLYAALQECHGADFDREHLMGVVRECRQAMDGFKGWYQLAHQANHKVANMQARLEKSTAEASKVKSLEERIQVLEKEKSEMMQLAPQVQKLQRQLDQLVSLN